MLLTELTDVFGCITWSRIKTAYRALWRKLPVGGIVLPLDF